MTVSGARATPRLRIAPSPTGFLHVGNVRAALFNWLYARRTDGVFIVRIDDTDRARSEEKYVSDIVSGLRWLGLDWDEGVEAGGPHGSYRQSDRFDRYREAAENLVSAGRAYRDFRPAEKLDELRSRAQAERKPPGHYIRRPDDSDAERDRARAEAGEKATIRFSVPPGEAVVFADRVRGEVRFESEAVDDFVILRSDGSPTYHLASVADDVDYGITDVARGEDLLSSTPKHILLTRALGAEPPRYAHLPLLLGPDGRKLSKRHGDTALRFYREAGFLPDAVFNYMSLLGWSLHPENEVFTRAEATAAFDLDDVQKSPAVFDTEKLEWMNGLYIRALPVAEFASSALAETAKGLGRELPEREQERLRKMAPLVQERVRLLSEVTPMVRFLLEDVEYDEAAWAKVMKEAGPVLERAKAALDAVEPWQKEEIEEALRSMLDKLGIKPRKGLQPIRVAVTGSNVSPPLFESLAALPRKEVVARLISAADRLEKTTLPRRPG